MADQVEYVDELQVKVTMERDGEQQTRTISVPNPKTRDVEQQTAMNAFRTKLMTGSLSGVVQPANWRDDGTQAEPYTTTDVQFAHVQTTKTIYDLVNP